MTVDDAHSAVIDALEGGDVGEEADGLFDLRLADLNDTERRHAVDALDALLDLDRALAERSSHERTDFPAEKSGESHA